MKKTLQPHDWGLEIGGSGELKHGSNIITELAEKFGTPLHVINKTRLLQTANDFKRIAEKEYPGKSAVHYAFKCNSVPAVVNNVKQAGLSAEVMTEFELELAESIGFSSTEIIVNGAFKTNSFIEKCLECDVKLIIVDSLDELVMINQVAESRQQQVDLLLRIDPDVVSLALKKDTAAGNRCNCAFGLDLKNGEVFEALLLFKKLKWINFLGYHFHIGTGITNPGAYSKSLKKLFPIFDKTREEGFNIKILDVGGGFAASTSRNITSSEIQSHQAFNYFPKSIKQSNQATISDFIKEISITIQDYFKEAKLPELIFEPGRCITGPNQFLLLKVHRTKVRSGDVNWLITDGGLGTVSIPTSYEYHEVFLCDDVNRPRTEQAIIIGPCCIAAEMVRKKKLMPKVHAGEVLAIMDSGAYFTALESSFGLPHPAIIEVNGISVQVARKRESFYNMIERDRIYTND